MRSRISKAERSVRTHDAVPLGTHAWMHDVLHAFYKKKINYSLVAGDQFYFLFNPS